MSPAQTYFPLAVQRGRVANGGWEWWLTIGGRRVSRPPHHVGIFTDPDVKPEDVLPRLLRAAIKDDDG